jgi:hypothetical protein
MRGKKADSEFLSNFISQSVQQGCDTQESIAKRAKNMIKEIDEQIKRIEEQKIIRSKLLDVINTFDVSNKSNKLEEAKILSFFKIQNPHICKFICHRLKVSGLVLKELNKTEWSELDLIYCIKQLIEFKVITKVGDSLLRGEKFEEYLKFVLKD